MYKLEERCGHKTWCQFSYEVFVLRVRATQPECIKMDGHILLCIRNSARMHMYSYLLDFYCFFSDFVSCIMMLLMFLYIFILLDRKWKDLYGYTKGPANAFGVVVEQNLSNDQEGLTPCFWEIFAHLKNLSSCQADSLFCSSLKLISYYCSPNLCFCTSLIWANQACWGTI